VGVLELGRGADRDSGRASGRGAPSVMSGVCACLDFGLTGGRAGSLGG
jgi:hypothetical protein